MEGNGKLLTVHEAVVLTGKSERTIYRYLKKGKLACQTPVSQMSDTCQSNVRHSVRLSKEEVVRVFGLNAKDLSDTCQSNVRQVSDNGKDLSDTKKLMKEVITEYFQDRETQLVKPLEEMATYRLGQVETENKFLKERLETLHEDLKVLPGPPVEVLVRLEELEEKNKDFQDKHNLKEQEIEKLKETVESHAEKSKNQEEIIQQQKEYFQEEEANYLATIGELKKQLEEERNKPWWKRFF